MPLFSGTSDEHKIRSISYEYERRVVVLNLNIFVYSQRQKRRIKTTTDQYVGVAIGDAPGLALTLKSTGVGPGYDVNAWYENHQNGMATVTHQVVDRTEAWTGDV